MLISAPKVRVFAEMASLAGARPPQRVPDVSETMRDSHKLDSNPAPGVDSPSLRSLIRIEPSAASVRLANDPSGRYAHVAIFFDSLLEKIKRQNPDIPEANARHLAQTETIIANRGIFPPSALFLYPEIGEAVPPPVADTGASGQADRPPLSGSEALYREWD